jgi:hypothetical protein
MKTCKTHFMRVLVRLGIRVLGTGVIGLMGAGCAVGGGMAGVSTVPQDGAAAVRISSLTEFVQDTASQAVSLRVLVEIVEANGFSTPMPCIMRFELYQFRPLSGDLRGKRLILWPQQDLTGTVKNNEHWKEHLHGYEFLLPVESRLVSDRNYVLEVTCLLDQRRLGDVFKVRLGR